MRHVEHPLVRHGVVVEVEYLLAGQAAAAGPQVMLLVLPDVLVHVLASVRVVPGGAPRSRADWKGGLVRQSPTRAQRSRPMATSAHPPDPTALTPDTGPGRAHLRRYLPSGRSGGRQKQHMSERTATPRHGDVRWAPRARPLVAALMLGLA